MNSVWSRLVVVLLLIVAPIGAVMVLVARDGLDSGLDNLHALQATAVAGRAGVIRAWLDAAGHSLASEAAAAGLLPADRCQQLVGTFLRRNSTFAAAHFVDEQGGACAAGEPIDLTQPFNSASVDLGDEAKFTVFARDGRIWVATGADVEKNENIRGVGLLQPGALSAQLPPYTTLGESHIALLSKDQTVVAQSEATDKSEWLPRKMPPREMQHAWQGYDRLGHSATFLVAPLAGLDLSILMRFDDTRADDARQRFLIVCALQLVLLVLLAFAYAATVRRDIVRWIKGVENAARARARDPESLVKAPVDPQMPAELRSVADAFNYMADRALDHQTALKASLSENRALMLEMHHRIKNSLQVIQSYLALIRRPSTKEEAASLLRIESRISVLAVAYRFALTPSGLRGIAIQPFLEEIGAAAIANLRRPRQTTELSLRWNGELDVDRAIPLGLGLVEALIAGFDGVGATHIAVTLNPVDVNGVRLAVESDGQRDDRQPPKKIMAGLAAQLGATSTASPRLVLCWDFHP